MGRVPVLVKGPDDQGERETAGNKTQMTGAGRRVGGDRNSCDAKRTAELA